METTPERNTFGISFSVKQTVTLPKSCSMSIRMNETLEKLQY